MVEVTLWSALRVHAGGAERVEVDGNDVGAVLDNLVAAYPGMAPVIEAGVSVAVNGRIFASALDAPVPDGAEVVIMQRIRGG